MKPFYEQPVLNSPYHVPTRYHALDAKGRPTDAQARGGRRRSTYKLSVIPNAKRRAGGQSELDLEEYSENVIVNEIRSCLEAWKNGRWFDQSALRHPLGRQGRHRLLVHLHRLQRRELLRAPRLFPRRNDPYKSLNTALRAEIDEDAWATLYSDVSRPFARPKTGRIAVKVINHFGDEVLKVFGV